MNYLKNTRNEAKFVLSRSFQKFVYSFPPLLNIIPFSSFERVEVEEFCINLKREGSWWLKKDEGRILQDLPLLGWLWTALDTQQLRLKLSGSLYIQVIQVQYMQKKCKKKPQPKCHYVLLWSSNALTSYSAALFQFALFQLISLSFNPCTTLLTYEKTLFRLFLHQAIFLLFCILEYNSS